jgi:hypothetical protein
MVLLSLLTLFFGSTGIAQTDSARYILYTPDFRFNEGVFLNFNQVKENRPVPKERIITAMDVTSSDFWEKLLKDTTFDIFDQNGMRQLIKVEDIWGYSNFGVLYILHNDEFNRIPVVGSLSHFVANMKVLNERPGEYYYRSPYYYNDPFYNRNRSYVTNELRQYFLDWESGGIMEYDSKNLKIILMRDPVLYDEYNNLSRSKQKKQIFLYQRKFNERHPLTFPATE